MTHPSFPAQYAEPTIRSRSFRLQHQLKSVLWTTLPSNSDGVALASSSTGRSGVSSSPSVSIVLQCAAALFSARVAHGKRARTRGAAGRRRGKARAGEPVLVGPRSRLPRDPLELGVGPAVHDLRDLGVGRGDERALPLGHLGRLPGQGCSSAILMVHLVGTVRRDSSANVLMQCGGRPRC